MKIIELTQHTHACTMGDVCPDLAPNVTEDCLFSSDGEIIGFYLKRVPDRLYDLITYANAELRSKRVPKSDMKRNPTDGIDEKTGKYKYKNVVIQTSAILGAIPPKPHMQRPYPSISSVHSSPTAQNFIKAMLAACRESEEIIRELTPHIFDRQLALIEQHVPQKYRFGRLFTSSISNYNIAAAYHRDAGNIVGCVNVILTKRENSTGGNTTVPDYGATVDSADGSMLVYPAWRNLHAVTPIRETAPGGYRNSLVFYPLKGFEKYFDDAIAPK